MLKEPPKPKSKGNDISKQTEHSKSKLKGKCKFEIKRKIIIRNWKGNIKPELKGTPNIDMQWKIKRCKLKWHFKFDFKRKFKNSNS